MDFLHQFIWIFSGFGIYLGVLSTSTMGVFPGLFVFILSCFIVSLAPHLCKRLLKISLFLLIGGIFYFFAMGFVGREMEGIWLLGLGIFMISSAIGLGIPPLFCTFRHRFR